MPDWSNYFLCFNDGTSASEDTVWSTSVHISVARIQRQYKEWKQECERQDCIVEQQMREAEELRKDKVRYPLFFLKEGIV